MGDGWVVVGATGLVGGALTDALHRAGEPVSAVVRREPPGMPAVPVVKGDLSDAEDVARAVRSLQPAVVAYCAGATAVDRCEADPDWAHSLNVAAARQIADALPDETLLVYLSTDYVFDGMAGPYDELNVPAPLNEYGRSKLAGEDAVRRRAEHLLVRTTVVYGWEPLRPPVGFLSRIVDAGARRLPLRCPIDEVGNPTAAPDLARAIIDLVGAGARGLFHVAGADRVSRWAFCREALTALGFDPDLARPVRSADLGRPARRPLAHGMNCQRAAAVLGHELLGVSAGLAGIVPVPAARGRT